MKRYFIRNARAQNLSDTFLVSGVSSILLLRFYLHLTGYPTVGGTKYHIAHMLYGGLLLVGAVTISLAFLGERRKILIALFGGAGFGIFIDEVGKFVTRDNNYFFRPSIGIIYASFVALYLLFGFLGRRRRLTSEEYQMNALVQLQEAIHHDMDPYEKQAVRSLLDHADQTSPITTQLQALLHSVDTVQPSRPHAIKRLLRKVEKTYRVGWKGRHSNQLVRLFFVVETLLFIALVVLALINNVDNVRKFFEGDRNYGHGLVVGQLVGTIVAAVAASVGLLRVATDRINAFEWFRRAVLINLLFTEFFIFSRIQFGALPSFLFNLALLLLINFVLAQERRTFHN